MRLTGSSTIEIQQPEGSAVLAESRQFDISKIDFYLLAQEFARVKRKNLMLKDLEDLVQDRLASMLAANPSRVDYYKRYMDIIEAYNAEQDRTTIEKTFMDLMDLVKEMSTEEQRYVREGFSSDEELSIYDLLFSDSLSKSDIQKIKQLSVELLKKIGQPKNLEGCDFLFDCLGNIDEPYFYMAVGLLKTYPRRMREEKMEEYAKASHESGDVEKFGGLLYLAKELKYNIKYVEKMKAEEESSKDTEDTEESVEAQVMQMPR